jgi:hypothetical protein
MKMKLEKYMDRIRQASELTQKTWDLAQQISDRDEFTLEHFLPGASSYLKDTKQKVSRTAHDVMDGIAERIRLSVTEDSDEEMTKYFAIMGGMDIEPSKLRFSAETYIAMYLTKTLEYLEAPSRDTWLTGQIGRTDYIEHGSETASQIGLVYRETVKSLEEGTSESDLSYDSPEHIKAAEMRRDYLIEELQKRLEQRGDTEIEGNLERLMDFHQRQHQIVARMI